MIPLDRPRAARAREALRIMMTIMIIMTMMTMMPMMMTMIMMTMKYKVHKGQVFTGIYTPTTRYRNHGMSRTHTQSTHATQLLLAAAAAVSASRSGDGECGEVEGAQGQYAFDEEFNLVTCDV
jgi:hypothetical protein